MPGQPSKITRFPNSFTGFVGKPVNVRVGGLRFRISDFRFSDLRELLWPAYETGDKVDNPKSVEPPNGEVGQLAKKCLGADSRKGGFRLSGCLPGEDPRLLQAKEPRVGGLRAVLVGAYGFA